MTTGHKHNGDAFEASRTSGGGNQKPLSGDERPTGIGEMESGSNPECSTKHCLCLWNSETGYFEPCCEAHEQEYVEYLEREKEAFMVSQLSEGNKPEATCTNTRTG